MTENEVVRSRFDRISSESHSQLNDLQSKYEKFSTENEQLKSYIRDLEQSNDDLDRAKRTLDATLAEFDSRLNEQVERNEILVSEISEKEQLQVVIQRLKDEARDLRLELMIQQSSKSSKKTVAGENESQHNNTANNTHSPSGLRQPSKAAVHSNGSISERLTNGSGGPSTPEGNKTFAGGNSPNYSSSNNTPKTPNQTIPLLSASSRISALNIVSDLLRKVGALESKLASCRSIVPVSASLMNSSKVTSPVKGSSTITNTSTHNNNVDLTNNSSVNSSTFKDINSNV